MLVLTISISVTESLKCVEKDGINNLFYSVFVLKRKTSIVVLKYVSDGEINVLT